MSSGHGRKRSKSTRKEQGEPEKKRGRHHDDDDKDKDKDRSREHRRSHSRSRSRSRSKSHHHSRHERAHSRSRERTDAKEGRRHEEVKVQGLPPGWRAYRSSSGDVFYYHSATRTRQWARPGEAPAAAGTTAAAAAPQDAAARGAAGPQEVPLDIDAETLARLAPPPLVMPGSMYAGAQFTEEERAALARAGVRIDGAEVVPEKVLSAPRTFLHSACLGCHRSLFDPRTAQFLGPLSCEKNPVPAVGPLPPLPSTTPCP